MIVNWSVQNLIYAIHQMNLAIPAVVRCPLTLLQIPPTESVTSCLGKTEWPIRSHGQECNLHTRTQIVDSKQAAPDTPPLILAHQPVS
jgi:hypothetical protein